MIGVGTIDHPKLAEAQAALAAGNDDAAATAASADVQATRERAAALQALARAEKKLAGGQRRGLEEWAERLKRDIG